MDKNINTPYWNISLANNYELLNSSINGLSNEEVIKRLNQYGDNTIKSRKNSSTFFLFINQFKIRLF